MSQKAWDKLIQAALTTQKQKSFNVSLILKVQDELWQVYGAEVCYYKILFFCDKGTAIYFVDSFKDRYTTELYDWEKSE